MGPPVVLVNNAGAVRDNALFLMSADDWDLVLGVNLRGAFLMTQAVLDHMAKAGVGRVVNLSSVAARGNPGQANYSAAKAGLEGLTRTLALELGPLNITVNAVAPGYVATEMTAALAARARQSVAEHQARAAEEHRVAPRRASRGGRRRRGVPGRGPGVVRVRAGRPRGRRPGVLTGKEADGMDLDTPIRAAAPAGVVPPGRTPPPRSSPTWAGARRRPSATEGRPRWPGSAPAAGAPPGSASRGCSTPAPSSSSTRCRRTAAPPPGWPRRTLGDGVVTGTGTVDGRPVVVYSQDATVFGGAIGEVGGEKILKAMDLAARVGCPIVGINDGGGARITEGVASLRSYGEIFMRNVSCSGVVPQLSLIMGPCAGGAVYSPALTDFTVMVDRTSHMFITGPGIVKAATGQEIGPGGPRRGRLHNTRTGVAHHLAADESDALAYVRRLLGHLPGNNKELPPVVAGPPPPAGEIGDGLTPADLELDTLIPDSPRRAYDVREILSRVLDGGGFLEVQPLFAANIVCGFGRVDGRSRRRGQPARALRRVSEHRRVREGGPLRAHLRRLQRARADLRRRARLPARHRPGVERADPPWREAHLRVRGGHRPQDHRDHPEGVRRRVRGDGLHAPRRGRQPRVADGADRGDRGLRRGERPLPPRAVGARRRGARRPPCAAGAGVRGLATPYQAADRGYVDAVIPPSAHPWPPGPGAAPAGREAGRRPGPASTATSRCRPPRPVVRRRPPSAPPRRRATTAQRNAEIPVTARPMTSWCTSSVPSTVSTASRFARCRATGWARVMPFAPRMVRARRATSTADRALAKHLPKLICAEVSLRAD